MRRPSLAERRRTLVQVFRLAEIVEAAALQRQGLAHRLAVGAQEDFLGRLLGERRTAGQALGVGHCLFQQVRLRHHPVDQADAGGELGIVAFARQDHLHRHAEADDLRQADQAAMYGPFPDGKDFLGNYMR